MIDIHNAVNGELNKPILNHNEAIDLYMNHSNNNDKFFKLAVLLILLGFVYLCIKK